ncbi:T9SS type A sorting domain-containing protein [Psychroserpens mesophilus]|uniref:T9SS type A sorting domain-containing protein n=1 Tax=Psychroserpens mesophilus TaxID=325473 RepID=UPI003F49840A
MKQKLLFTFLLTSYFTFAQAPISSFVNSSQKAYAIIDSTNPLDESASGTNATWNFTSLSPVGINTDTNVAPTSAEQTAYPGTTEVLVVTTNSMPPTESKLFISNQSDLISITGVVQDLFTLNFTNNATLGQFPLTYNFSNGGDTVGGSFEGDANGTTVSGTISGSFDTTVDAYGTLNLNDFGLGAYNGSVTRLKTELDVTLLAFGIINIGTVTQTSYFYYDDTDGNLVFRTSTNVIDIDAFGTVINETIRLYEVLDRSTLSIASNTLSPNEMKLFPNPVSSILNIKLSDDSAVTSAQIFDMNGRAILTITDNFETINVSDLQSGLYILNIETSKGFITKRFIKK